MTGDFIPRRSLFKFEEPFQKYHKLSLSLYFFIIIGSILFTYTNLQIADDVSDYTGLQTTESNNMSFILSMLPPPSFHNLNSIMFFQIDSPNQGQYYIDGEICCQWFRLPTNLVIPIQSYVLTGYNKIFSTRFFSFDSMLLQLYIRGDDILQTNFTIILHQTNSLFGKTMVYLRLVFSIISFACLIIYVFTLCFSSMEHWRAEHILTTGSLVLSSFSNFPITFSPKISDNITVNCIDLVLCGVFTSYNIVALFLFNYHSRGGKYLGYTFLVSLLFIAAHALSQLSSDTRILAKLFDDNEVLWLFFTSISLASRISLACYFIYYDFFPFAPQPNPKRWLIRYTYMGLVLVTMISQALSGLMFIYDGTTNSAVEFLDSYLLNTFLALAFADIHWPIGSCNFQRIEVAEFQIDDNSICFTAVEEGTDTVAN